MIIIGIDKSEISNQKRKLFQEWNEWPRKFKVFFEVLRLKGGIFINQRKYILNLLVDIEMIDCKISKNTLNYESWVIIDWKGTVDK